MSSTPRRPYLVRAMYEWMLDNDLTPHIILDASIAGVVVPAHFAKEEALRLSIGPAATQDLHMDNDYVSFTARVNGKVEYITVPQIALLGILSRETNEGMFFSEDDYPTPEQDAGSSQENGSPTPEDEPPTPPTGRPSLRVVK